MNKDTLKFYPKHPSNLKTLQIETMDMPLLEQMAPFAVAELHQEFIDDLNGALAIYKDKCFEVTGYAIKVGLDVHNKPSIELSDCVGGDCHALCIFQTDAFYGRVSVGDKVVVRANYLVFSNWFGVVMKHSELIEVEKR